MTTHRFTINVPNPTPRKAVVQLQIEAAQLDRLNEPGLDLPAAPLELVRAGLALDPCDDGLEGIRLILAPHASADVFLTAVTGEARDERVGGVTAFNVIDRRGGKIAGGVLLACVDRPGPESPGQEVLTKRICPVVLA